MATQRVLAGISYKDGVDQQTIAFRHGVHRNTVRNWLQRLDDLPDAPLADVVYDSRRSGRPRALEPNEFAMFVDAVTESSSPDHPGHEARWTAERARAFIEAEFGVEYSTRHARRLLSAAKQTTAGNNPDKNA